jgi:hypothetical protein
MFAFVEHLEGDVGSRFLFGRGCKGQENLIQVDIGGHPPFPTGSKQLSSNFDNLLFLAVFRVLNFRIRFEALNDVFWGMLWWKNFIMKFCAIVVVLGYIFPMGYDTPKTEIVCKRYDPRKLMYELTQMGPT